MSEVIYLDNVKTQKFKRPIPAKINEEEFHYDLPEAKKSEADPLKDVEDINRVTNLLTSTGRYRDNLLFIMGINFGLRIGDLLNMRIGHILNSDGSFRSEVRVGEQKTGKVRICYINNTVMDAAELYLTSIGNEINLNDFLFTSQSNNNSASYYTAMQDRGLKVKGDVNSKLTTKSADRILKGIINDELGIDVHASTHLLRKTFAYHVILNAPNRDRAIEFLQKILGHSSQTVTLHYAGITKDEIKTVCEGLNLGANGMNMGKEFCYAAGLSNVV